MKIIQATYGNKDVTDIIQKLVIDNKLSFDISNNIFGGDPLPNIVKYLNISYEYNGLKECSFRENEKCILPRKGLER